MSKTSPAQASLSAPRRILLASTALTGVHAWAAAGGLALALAAGGPAAAQTASNVSNNGITFAGTASARTTASIAGSTVTLSGVNPVVSPIDNVGTNFSLVLGTTGSGAASFTGNAGVALFNNDTTVTRFLTTTLANGTVTANSGAVVAMSTTLGSLTYNGSGSVTATGTASAINLETSGTTGSNNIVVTIKSGSIVTADRDAIAARVASGNITIINDGTVSGTIVASGPAGGTRTLSNTGIVRLAQTNALGSFTAVTNTGLIETASALLTASSIAQHGTLRAMAELTIGTAMTIGSGSAGTFDTNGFGLTLSGAITGAGTLVKSGTGTLTLSGANANLTGPVTVSSGTLRAGSGTGFAFSGPLTVGQGTFVELGGFNATVSGLGGTGTIQNVSTTAATLTVNVASGTQTFSGSVATGSLSGGTASAALSLTKAGAGTLTLTKASSYTGTTTITGGTLSLGNEGALGFSSSVSIANNARLQIAYAPTTSFTKTIALGTGGGTIDTNGIGVTVSGLISGSGNLSKIGAGTLTLSGTNTYSGTTSANEGRLAFADFGALGTGRIVLGDGTLQYTGSADAGTTRVLTIAGNSLGSGTIDVGSANVTFSGGLAAGTGALTKVGSGTLALKGSNARTGGLTTVAEGTLSVSDIGMLGGNTTLGGAATNGTLVYEGATAAGKTQLVTLAAGGGTVSTTGGTLTLSNVAGAGALTKTGSGTLVLSGSIAYTGTTTVAGGTLSVVSTPVLGSSSGLVLSGGGTLQVGLANAGYGNGVTVGAGGGTIETTAAGSTFALTGTVSGSGTLTKTGAGTLTLMGADNTGFTGGFSVDAGTLAAGSSAALGSAQIALNGGTLQATASFAAGNAVVLGSGNGTINTAAAGTTLTLSGALSGNGTLTKTGAGTLTLSGTNSAYPGNVTIGAGTLAITGTQALGSGDITLDGGTLLTSAVNATTNAAVKIGTGNGTINTAVTLTLNGTISGPGRITKTGGSTLFLYGDNTAYGGGFTVNQGVLWVDAGTALGSGGITLDGGTLNSAGSYSAGNIVTVGPGGASVNTINPLTTVTLSNGIAGSGSLNKTGTGTLVLAAEAAADASFVTTISNGTLAVGHDRSLGTGQVTITANGTLALQAGASAAPVLANAVLLVGNGAVATGEFGTVSVGPGELTLGGTVTGQGGLRKTGGGTLVFTNGKAYFGDTVIQAGTVRLAATRGGSGGALSASRVVLAGGTLAIDSGNTAASLARVVVSDGTASTVQVGTGLALDWQTPLAGTGNLTVTGGGAVTVTANSTAYQGAVTVTQASLAVAGGVTLGNGGASVTVGSGGTLSGFGTVAGTVTVQGGGTLSAGASPGTLTITGDLALAAGSTSSFELGSPGYVGTSATIRNDLVVVAGALTLGGTLKIQGDGTAAPVSGYYRLFNYGTLTAGSAYASIVDGNGQPLSASATVLTDVAGQVNLLYAASGQAVQFFNGTNTQGNTGTVPSFGGPQGGPGPWDGSTTNWTSGGGAGSNITDVWRQGVGVFAGAAGGTVDVGSVAMEGLQFTTGGYALTGGTITLAGNATGGNPDASFVTVDGGITATIGSALGGAKGLDKQGAGTLVLSGVNTYSGGTRVLAGTLAIAGDQSLGVGGLTLAANTTLRVDVAATLAGAVTLGLTGTGPGTATIAIAPGEEFAVAGGLGEAFASPMTLTKTGGGGLRLGADGTYTGGTRVEAGYVVVGASGALGTGAVVLADTTGIGIGANGLSIANAIAVSGGTGTIDTDGRAVALSGRITTGAGTLKAMGGGIVSLNNVAAATPNAIAGLLVVDGTRIVNAGTAPQSVTLDNGVYAVAGDRQLSGSLQVNAGGGTLDGNGHVLTFDGSLTGSGSLTTTGQVVMTGTGLSGYAGDVTVAGTLLVQAPGRLGTGGHAFGVVGGGTLGGTGTVRGTVTVQDGGTLSPGTGIGTLTIDGDLALAAGATSRFTLASPGYVGSGGTIRNDLVVVTGALTLGGTLAVSGDGTAAPTSGYYRLFNTGTLTPGSSFGAIVDGNGADVSASATVLTTIDKQVNLLFRAGQQSVQFFDGSDTVGNTGSTPNAVPPQGGPGVWTATRTNWTTGGSVGSNINDQWRQGVAIFAGAAGGPVTVDTSAGAIDLQGMQFATDGYTLTGGELGLAGNAVPGGNANASFVTVDTGVTATVGSILSGAKGLDKLGGGTLVLAGANTYAGGTDIRGGTVVVGHAAAFGADAGTVTMQDGTVVRAGGSFALAQSFALNGTSTFDTGGQTLSLTGSLVATPAGTTLLKTGAGTLALSGDSGSFGGRVDLSQGAMAITQAGILTVSGLAIRTGTSLVNDGIVGGTGGSIVNDGILTSTGTLVDATAIVNNGTLSAQGVLTAPRVVNAGTFTATGALSGQTANPGAPFAGPIGELLNTGAVTVGASDFTGVAIVRNLADTASLFVAAGGRLGSSGTGGIKLDQTAGTTTIAGTMGLSEVSVTGGTFTSTGAVIAPASILNTATMNLAGGVATPVLNNTGTLTITGPLAESFGGGIGRLNNIGPDARMNLGGNTVTGIGTLANTGVITGGGVLSGATLTGTGVIDLRPGGSAGLAQDATRSLTVGTYAGDQTVKIALDPVAGTAGRIIATVGGTPGSTLTFLISQTSLRPTSAPITIAQGVTGTRVTATTDNFQAFNVGFVNTQLINPSAGLWQVTTTVNPNAGAPAASISSVITALSTGFFSSTNAFITSPTDTRPNTWHGGPWVRIQAGQYDTESLTTVGFGSVSGSAQTKIRTSFAGFQVGSDIGLLNAGGSGVNLHAGVTAGSVSANAGQQASATPTKGSFSVPFVGAYAAVVYGAFAADLQYRHDFYTMDLTNPIGFTGTLANQKGEGNSVNGSATYRFTVFDSYFVEPGVGFNYTQVDVDPFKAATAGRAGVQAGSLVVGSLESLLGRAGMRAGFTTVLGERYIVQPFVTAAVWHEFSGNVDSAFTFTDSKDKVAIATGRVGTFGQAGLGVTGQIVGKSIVGYIRADARFGDRIRGGSVNMGLRYDF